jgi:hypothetical protein
MSISHPFDAMDDLPEPPTTSPSHGKNSAAEQGLEIPMGWKPTASEPVPVVRCKANSSTTGERCKRWSIRGTTVCAKHGGQLPSVVEHAQAVVESARLRLMGMADDAVEVLYDLVQPGVSDQIRLNAAKEILNRSGLNEAIKVEVEHSTVSQAEEIHKKLAVMRDRFLASQAKDEEELEDQGEILDEPEKEE